MSKKYAFPKVDLPNVGRTNFDLDKSSLKTFSPGTIRCLWSRDTLPGDHWEIQMNAAIESMPMLSPLYGEYQAKWAFFAEPWSNIYGWMDNNTKRSTKQIINTNLLVYMLPYHYRVTWNNHDILDVNLDSPDVTVGLRYQDFDPITYKEYSLIYGVAPSSIWEDFGWPTGFKGDYYSSGDPSDDIQVGEIVCDSNEDLVFDTDFYVPNKLMPREFTLHGLKPFAYLDIVRNYYVNNQMEYAAYIGYIQDQYGAATGERTVNVVSLEVLDYIFMFLRSVKTDLYHDINEDLEYHTLSNWFESRTALEGYESIHADAVKFLASWTKSYCVQNGGCFLTNYKMDLNRGLLNSSVGTFRSQVSTDGNSFTVVQLRFANKTQKLIDILDLSGGRFSDWVRCLWSVDLKGDVDKPIYLGSISTNIYTKDIVSNTTVPEGSTSGQQTGFSVGGVKGRKITFNSDIYATVFCIFTLTPKVRYSCAFKREDLKSSFDDIYNPQMAQLGYQSVPRSVLSAIPDYTKYVAIADNGSAVNTLKLALYDDPDLTERQTWPDFIDVKFDDYLNKVVGKQVAWSEYMSDVDDSAGLFAEGQSLDYWTLNRKYNVMNRNVGISYDNSNFGPYHEYQYVTGFYSTTYVDPSLWNNIFADVQANAQNFRMYYNMDVFVKRGIPKRTLGTL